MNGADQGLNCSVSLISFGWIFNWVIKAVLSSQSKHHILEIENCQFVEYDVK